MPECIFCKIINGDIPSYNVYEDGHSFAFLDINPMAPGHTLVVSKEHVEFMSDMNDDAIGEMFKAVRKVGDSIVRNLKPDGINYFVNQGEVAGQIIAHVHCHIVPREAGDDISFEHGKTDLSDEEMKEIADKVKV